MIGSTSFLLFINFKPYLYTIYILLVSYFVQVNRNICSHISAPMLRIVSFSASCSLIGLFFWYLYKSPSNVSMCPRISSIQPIISSVATVITSVLTVCICLSSAKYFRSCSIISAVYRPVFLSKDTTDAWVKIIKRLLQVCRLFSYRYWKSVSFVSMV